MQKLKLFVEFSFALIMCLKDTAALDVDVDLQATTKTRALLEK